MHYLTYLAWPEMVQWWRSDGAVMVQWWERSPPTNVSRVRFPDLVSYVGCVCCWFSTLFWEVFPQVLQFFLFLLKNQHFQIPIPSWNVPTFLNEFLWTPWYSVGKQIILLLQITLMDVTPTTTDPLGSCAFGTRNWSQPSYFMEQAIYSLN